MLRLLQKWVINTFGFSKSETNGSLILIFLVLIIAIVPRLIINNITPHEVSIAQDSITLTEWFEASQKALSSATDEKVQVTEARKTTILKPKPFDPNQVSMDQLLAFGLSANVAKNIISYRNAGGSYSLKSDIQKIYGMTDNTYEKLKDYILLPEERPYTAKTSGIASNTSSEESTAESKSLIDLNYARADDLQVIRGIGPTLSERIIKYRDLLGGFHSKDQLSEIYGLNEDVLSELKDQIAISDSTLKKININSDDPKELSAHPYINYSLSKTIINYRKIHGPFQENSDLKQIKIVSDSLFQKLSPYISLRP